MVNNSTNINKTKESWNSDGQQFHQYQQNKRKIKQWWSTIPPISTKQRNLNSDGQQFHQYEQIEKSRQWCQHFLQYQSSKRKFKQWWSTIPPISRKQKKVETVMVDNSTNINKTKESLSNDGQQFHQYQQNKRKVKQWWSTIPPISTKQKKV